LAISNFACFGTDYSANAVTLGSLSLLNTIPPDIGRAGYFIQNHDAADNVYVAYDTGDGSDTPTVLVLAPATAANGQGGTAERSGMPHTGRIRIYGDHSTTKMAARSW
jgi:hypothetical protein